MFNLKNHTFFFVKRRAAVTTSLTLQPDATAGIDTSVDLAAPTATGSVSATFTLRGFASTIARGLVKFDLSTLSALSSPTYLTGTLSLFGVGSGSNAALALNRILPVNISWTENGASWNFTNGSTRWAGDTGGDGGADAGCGVSGTDYSGTTMGSIASFNATAGVENQFNLNLTELGLMVANNIGIVIRDTSTSASATQPGSSDNATAARRPKLVVWYSYIP